MHTALVTSISPLYNEEDKVVILTFEKIKLYLNFSLKMDVYRCFKHNLVAYIYNLLQYLWDSDETQ